MRVEDVLPAGDQTACKGGGGNNEVTPELRSLYREFERENVAPLWTGIGELMPLAPKSRAEAHLWRWERLVRLAGEAGRLVPVGRGGERRALALANPSLGGRPWATPTLWAAIQYLMPGENAPEHRHTQHAFRFVVEGEGVWTVVNGDPVRMSRGDFLPQGGWNWHAHHNAASQPMTWIDGLDIPFSLYTESTFFEFGRDELGARELSTPVTSRSERLWGYPGLRPLSHLEDAPSSPLLAYRWVDTDRALDEQLALEAEGVRATKGPGHAAVRFINPTSGRDVLPTIRCEMHRVVSGASTVAKRETGSSVCQVFDGEGTVRVGDRQWQVSRGDMFVVPSWHQFTARCDESQSSLDLFCFSDAPIFEKLNAWRAEIDTL